MRLRPLVMLFLNPFGLFGGGLGAVLCELVESSADVLPSAEFLGDDSGPAIQLGSRVGEVAASGLVGDWTTIECMSFSCIPAVCSCSGPASEALVSFDM